MTDPKPNQTNPATPHSEQWYAAAARDLKAFDAEERAAWGGIDETLIAAYAAGTCTPDEKARVDQAIEKHPAVGESVRLVRESMTEGPSAASGDDGGSPAHQRPWAERAPAGEEPVSRKDTPPADRGTGRTTSR